MRFGSSTILFVVLLGGLSPTQFVRADLIAYWSFNSLAQNTNSTTTFAPDLGAGAIRLFGCTSGGTSTPSGSTLNAIPPDIAGQNLVLVKGDNNGAELVCSFAMAGFVNPVLTFADRRTGTGFDSIRVSYSTDGATFTDVAAPYQPTTGEFELRTIDLSNIEALDGAATAYVKFTFEGANSPSGQYRIDNVQINAIDTSPMSKPFTVIASGIVIALLFGYGSRRRH